MNRPVDAHLVKLPQYVDADSDGLLVVTEAGEHVPFHQIHRMFTIVAPAGAKRGRHAHRLCSQLMMCVKGAAAVICDDGANRHSFTLDSGETALFVPPELWVEIDMKHDESVLIVLCDRVYEEHDYIRDYDKFLSFRKTPRA